MNDKNHDTCAHCNSNFGSICANRCTTDDDNICWIGPENTYDKNNALAFMS